MPSAYPSPGNDCYPGGYSCGICGEQRWMGEWHECREKPKGLPSFAFNPNEPLGPQINQLRGIYRQYKADPTQHILDILVLLTDLNRKPE